MKRIKPIHKDRFSRKGHRFISSPQPNSASSDSEEDFSSPYPLPSLSLLEQLDSPDSKQREFASSLLMNLSSEISYKQLDFLYTEACLNSLLKNLKDKNPQIILNILDSVKGLLETEELLTHKEKKNKKEGFLEVKRIIPFEKTLFLIKEGLFEAFVMLMERLVSGLRDSSLLVEEAFKGNLRKVLSKLLNVISSYCEVVELKHIDPLIKSINPFLLEMLLSIEDEEIFLEVLNLFHITTEFSHDTRRIFFTLPTEREPGLFKLTNILKKPLIDLQNTGLFLAKSYILGILYNLLSEKTFLTTDLLQEIILFLNFALKTPVFQEFPTFLQFISKETAQEKQPANLQIVLALWLKASKALINTMLFLNSLLDKEDEFEDISDNEDEEIEEKKDQNIENISKMNDEDIDQHKTDLLKQIIAYNNKEVLNLISERLVLEKDNAILFDKYETSGLEELNNRICHLSFLAVSALEKVFSENIPEISVLFNVEEKKGFLSFLWVKIKGFSLIMKEIEGFPEIKENFLQFMRAMVSFIENNKGIFIDSGVIDTIILKEDVFQFGSNIFLTKKEEIILLFFDLMTIRFPISMTNRKEFLLTNNDNLMILEIILKGITDIRTMVKAQALNALFDIYADETYNESLREKNVIGILEKIDEGELKTEKKQITFIKETIINLKGFIKYKRNLGI